LFVSITSPWSGARARDEPEVTLTIIIESLVVIGLLFIPAGTAGWIAGWVFVALLCGVTHDDRRPSNPIVITGDLHCSWVADLKAYYPNEDSDTVCTEFVGTSITSGLGEYYKEAYRGFEERTEATCAVMSPKKSGAWT
jgi:hypothetical protein